MRQFKILPLLLCAALFALSAAGCGRQPADTPAQDGADAESGKLRVITTIFPPYDFVREIAGDSVELTMLLRPGAESHSFEPSPQDIIAIGECDLFIHIGGDTDVWVDRILESVDRDDLRVVALMDLVDAVEEEIVEGMEHSHSHGGDDRDHEDGDHDHEDDDHDDHDHNDDDHDDHDHEVELDEHVWTSPVNAARIVESLCETLGELDPDSAERYRRGAEAYLEELRALDEDFRALVDSAQRTTILFGDRFPFRYLADAYGLEYFAAFPGCSTETEASASTVAFLIDKVKDEGIPVVFYIELSNQKMADTICEETGAVKRELHSCHNLTRDEFEAGESYLSLMRKNLASLEEALN